MFITLQVGYSDFDFHDFLNERKGLIISTIKRELRFARFLFLFLFYSGRWLCQSIAYQVTNRKENATMIC